MKKGVFIVIDGSDGSGKGTQHELLKQRLEKENIAYSQYDFPQHGKPSAYFVRQYLNGNYGGLDDVPPERGSIFYALDRFEASFGIKDALKSGKVVLSNRFTASNLAHHGAKIADPHARRAFFEDIESFEHGRMGIPKPDCNIILIVPAEVGQRNVDKKAPRGYTTKKRDIHENDVEYLSRSVDVYNELCTLFPGQYIKIDCMQNAQIMKPTEAIHELIWQQVKNRINAAGQLPQEAS